MSSSCEVQAPALTETFRRAMGTGEGSGRRAPRLISCLVSILLPLCAASALEAEVSNKTSFVDLVPDRLSPFPTTVSLHNSRASQRLVVQAHFHDGVEEDWTGRVEFSCSNSEVASVDPDGRVLPISDGQATVRVVAGDLRAEVPVEVRNSTVPFVWSFQNHVIPVMTKAGCNSGACHGTGAGKNGFKLTLRGYDPETDYNVLTRQAVGRRVVKTEPARSLILLKPTLAIAHGGGKRFGVESTSYRIIADWIASGSPSPSEDAPTMTRLEIFPSRATLRPQSYQQLLVLAHYSDGHTEDVTAWSRYGSTDLGVASVDRDGHIQMMGYGEAAITVGYRSQIGIARFTVPFPHLAAERIGSLLDQAPRQNYIDDRVLAKLRQLRIPPAGLASDAEFIRRVYLDTIGILPSAREVEDFLGDASPNKRTSMIDALLLRPEFVDYWTYKWSDVLLLKGAGQSNPGAGDLSSDTLRGYYEWIRSSVQANKPWDWFVRELLVSSGSNVENGAVNYLVTNMEPLVASENVSKAFLGLSLGCAKCHNHPMEKWTQNDYYAMANLFGRIGYKNGSSPSEVIVFTKPAGEIIHPRLGRPLAPRTLDGSPLDLDSPIDRRAHLAEWLTSAENPLFARTLVNRVWGNFLGRGLVDPVDDMRATNPASNEELLSALTSDFVDHGFDLRYLIRTIIGSATYQLSSSPNEFNVDDTRYNSRYVPRRLSAEVILDGISQVTAVAEKFPGFALGTRALQLPDANVRSYFLTGFGRNPRNITDETERETSPSLTQVLHITNGDTINRKLMAPGGAVDMLIKLGLSNERIIEYAYLSAFSRYPTVQERKKLTKAMREAEVEADKEENELRRELVEDLFWSVLTSKEFLFNK